MGLVLPRCPLQFASPVFRGQLFQNFARIMFHLQLCAWTNLQAQFVDWFVALGAETPVLS